MSEVYYLHEISEKYNILDPFQVREGVTEKVIEITKNTGIQRRNYRDLDFIVNLCKNRKKFVLAYSLFINTGNPFIKGVLKAFDEVYMAQEQGIQVSPVSTRIYFLANMGKFSELENFLLKKAV